MNFYVRVRGSAMEDINVDSQFSGSCNGLTIKLVCSRLVEGES